jgi:tetratricopeptide (TPR) repeat protein
VRQKALAWVGVLVVFAGCATSLDKARTAKRTGDYADAESHYREALDDPKLETTARQELAGMHVERAADTGDPALTEALLRRALELDPAHDGALTALVRLMRRTDRLDDAKALLEETSRSRPCGACQRLQVVVLLELGEREVEAERWEAALAHFDAAQKIRRQAGSGVAIANARARAGQYAEAVAALEAVRELLVDADASRRASFFDVRAFVVAAAIEKHDLALADRARALALAGEPPGKQLALGLMVADHVLERGDTQAAAARFEALLELPDLDDAGRAKLVDRATKIHANEATAHLHAGNAEAADAALARAIALRPDDWVLKLQRVVAISARSGAQKALDSLDAVPPNTVGLADTRAIVLSLRVAEQLDAGDLSGARATLARAQKTDPDLPEVHLATARVLARTAVTDFDRRELAALRGKGSLVRYRGDVLRFGEALSEIDFVKAELAKRRKTTLFTAPWIAAATQKLENEVFAAYPHAVKFREQAEPLVVLFNGGDRTIDVTVTGPDDYADRAVIAPDDLHQLSPPRAGVLHLRIGRTKRVFFAEPFIEVTLKL